MALLGYEEIVNSGVNSTLNGFLSIITQDNISAGAASQFWSHVDNDGYYIRVATANDGSGNLPFYVFEFDKGAKTFAIAVLTDLTTSSNTRYITLDDSLSSFPAVGAAGGRNACFANFISFFHPATSGGTDLTGSGRDMSVGGSPTTTTGLFSTAARFNGIDQNYVSNSADQNTEDEITLGALFQFPSSSPVGDGSNTGIASIYADGSNRIEITEGGSDQRFNINSWSPYFYSYVFWTELTWYNIAFASDVNTPRTASYRTTAAAKKEQAVARGQAAAKMRLASSGDATGYQEVDIEVVYIYDGAYSDDLYDEWKANVQDPASFFTGQGYTSLVVNNPPTGSVTITGVARVGETLTVSNDLADADGLGSINYQWKRDDVDISGETGNIYILSVFDVGSVIKCTASYTDGDSNQESVDSAPTSAILSSNTTTYKKSQFTVTSNPAYSYGSTSHSNFVLEVLTADIPASFLDGSDTSAENGGGNIRAYINNASTELNRIALKVVSFDINTNTAALKVLVPSWANSTANEIVFVKGKPSDTQPAASAPYGSDEVDVFDPDLVPPADPSDLKTTYDNMDSVADFITAGALTWTQVGGVDVDYKFLKSVFRPILQPVMRGYDEW